jgi:NADP-dependent 3-hydroxy acid dehydrogenase YdfG
VLRSRIGICTFYRRLPAPRGIGATTAKTLTARGAKVALLACRLDRLDDFAAEIIADGGTVIAV